jgi:hypothetical protein
MRQRTEQAFRAVLRHIDLGIDALEEEKELLAKTRSNGADLQRGTAVDLMLARLTQFALDVEFEVQLGKSGRSEQILGRISLGVDLDAAAGSPERAEVSTAAVDADTQSRPDDLDLLPAQNQSPLQIRLEKYFREHPRDAED